MEARYINPFTDFGFKKLFGEEVNKDLLKDFLNGFLPDYHKIKDLQYKKTDQLGDLSIDRKAIFDIYCQSENGDRFIVELQKAKQNFFKERSLYYATFPIREQAEKGDWDYSLKAVYCVGILDFTFEEERENKDYLHLVKLKNEHNQVFYDKLTFVYIEMPKFLKTESELETEFDKWLFFIRNLENFEHIPDRLKSRIFERAFQIAEIARFEPSQMQSYQSSLKYYRDLKNVVDTSFVEGKELGIQEGKELGIQEGKELGIQEGKELGILQGKIEAARKMIAFGMAKEQVLKAMGLTEGDILGL